MALKVAFLGDVCLTGKFDIEQNPNALTQFARIKSELSRYDVVIANLESPLTDRKSSRVCKAIHIKSPPANIATLQYLGVTAVNLANNHVFDYGGDGVASTVAVLKSAGIEHFGIAGRSALLEVNGQRMALGGFCCLTAHPTNASASGVNPLTYANVSRFVECVPEGVLPVVSVHWGDENAHYPRADHVRFARLLARDRHLLWHGHHPHVQQGIERCSNGSVIAYSLGNFCTDEHVSTSVRSMRVRQSAENLKSFVLGVSIERGRLTSTEVLPLVDAGAAIEPRDADGLAEIEQYSEPLRETHYVRPAFVPPASGPGAGPRRFGVRWFRDRLNYQFIGAFLKGIVNRIRYQYHFSIVRIRVQTKGWG
jgi:poly-gamma-glutamate capsule biosynthesis protein CapA/YwtB (metallophosphatase superfamily)